jgi:hypothetical protein
MLLAAAKILAIKAGTSIDQPACLVSLPALFCAKKLKLILGQLISLEQSSSLRYL